VLSSRIVLLLDVVTGTFYPTYFHISNQTITVQTSEYIVVSFIYDIHFT